MQRRLIFYTLVAIIVSLLMLSIFSCIESSQAQETDNDGKSRMKSQLYMLGDSGGGHIEWWLEGKIAKDIRHLIDSNETGFGGNSDGTLQGSERKESADFGEVHNFIEHLENKVLESHIFRGAFVKRADCEKTSGLTGTSVNSTEEIYIYITFSAEFKVPKREVELNGNPFLEWVLIDELLDENEPYSVLCEDEHTSIIVGFGCVYQPKVSHGTFTKYRIGIGEIITYKTKYSTQSWTDNSEGLERETARYEGFYWLESPLELLLFIIIFGYVTISTPKWVMLKEEMEKVNLIHYLSIFFVVICVFAYVLNLIGLGVIILSISTCVITYVLSIGIYKFSWGNLSKPKYRMLKSAKNERKIKCQNCNTVFVVKPTNHKVKCPSCGNEGKLE